MLVETHIKQLIPPSLNDNLWHLELQETVGERTLLLTLSEMEACQISKGATQNGAFPDLIMLISEMAADMNLRLERIIISQCINGDYHASLEYDSEGTHFVYDVLASEAIAIAIAEEAQIFIDDKFLDNTTHPVASFEKTITTMSAEELVQALNNAIQQEKYELAGAIRDEINRRKKS